MKAEIKILKRLRQMLVRRSQLKQLRYREAMASDRPADALTASTEKHSVNWCIHDLDFVVEDLKFKQQKKKGNQ